jgi:hypothetical protein
MSDLFQGMAAPFLTGGLMISFTIKERVEFRSADFQEDSGDFVAILTILDKGGFDIGLVQLVVNTPEALIELGQDLMLAGAQLRQFVDEWPEGQLSGGNTKASLTFSGCRQPTAPLSSECDTNPQLSSDCDKEAVNGYSGKEAAA